MKSENKKTGSRGEELALGKLLSKGYQLLQKNYGNKFGEIDLVMRDGKTIVFVEVKTKIGDDFGTPEEMVNRNKLARVRKMGEVFLVESGNWNCPCRIDVVAVVLSLAGEVVRLTHYQGV